MLLQVEVLGTDQVRACRERLEQASWADGGVTAGFQSRTVKNNLQLPESSETARELGTVVLDALDANLLFNAAALPARVFPPLFNCYRDGQDFGNHVDNAIRTVARTRHRIRTDISATLFLSEPEDYDGGELVLDDTYGPGVVKLPAGHMVLYPGTSLHRVLPVTRGARYASFFWIQSLVREDSQRAILIDMDMAIVRLRQQLGDNGQIVALTGVYHNLLRRWASV
jgi:PKHD-type hydroxylase